MHGLLIALLVLSTQNTGPHTTAALPLNSPSAASMPCGHGAGVGRLTDEEQNELLLRMLVVA